MAHALDTHGTEVHRQHVEGGFGTALDGCRHQGREAVDAVGLHGFDQHGPRRTAGERLDQRRGQAFDEAGVQPHPVHRVSDAIQRQLQRPGSA
ncbi:hypothetical protein D3C71_1781630 [compost metagenome]